jgi:aspartyl-tRNA(Asn)/glutamyl-tRNA(Gln) amidotransferase subunit A
MADDLAFLGAAEIVERYRSKSLSPREVLDACLRQIERHDPGLNAMAHVATESARAEAAASEARWQRSAPLGPLDGVPVAVKDLIPVAGMPLRYGSAASDPDPVAEDAPSVTNLRKAGAVITGKTNTAEHGWKGVCDNPLSGVTRNPWNLDLTPGGSSGGSGVAVATGMAALALGGDEGGSIRIPASFCGIAGLKPTWGRVPLHPPMVCGTWSHVGPMARSVGDLAVALNALAHPDPRDWESLPETGTDYTANLKQGAKGLRIALSPGLGHVALDPEVEAAVRAAAQTFSDLGATVVEATPAIGNPIEPYYVLVRLAARAIVDSVPASRRQLLEGVLRKDAADADRHSGMDVKAAEMEQRRLGGVMASFFEDHDILLTATTAVPPFAVGIDDPNGGKRTDLPWTGTLFPFNFTRLPAASVPCGLTSSALPIGLHLVGARHADATVLRAAAAYEAAVPGIGRPPGA